MKAAPQWHDAGAAGAWPAGTMRAWRGAGRQLVIGRTSAGRWFALDNRCPHEGYPLAQGTLKDQCLTCTWHNWKFEVSDGSCVLGGEAVRAYPVREKSGRIEVDLREPGLEEQAPALLHSLAAGLFRDDAGRAIRDGVRLLHRGYDPWLLLAELARYDALHGEYGSSHVLALSGDCGRLAARWPGVEAMHAVAPVIELCGESNERLPPRPQPAPRPGADAAALRRAVEQEDDELAESLLLGAFAAGVETSEIEGWLYALLSDHFLDFGHPLIYLVKAQELLRQVPASYARDLYPALLYGVVLGTREDTLPYLKNYFQRWRELEEDLPTIHRAELRDAPFRPEGLRDAVLDGSLAEACDAVAGALRSGVPAARIARALVGAAAHRLYRFDLRHDQDPDVSEGWLWATHRLTFASAARNAVERFPRADSLRFLLQAAAFIHSGKGMDAPDAARALPEPQDGGTAAVARAVAARDAEAACRLTLGCLHSGRPFAELQHVLEDCALHAPLVRPIVVAHAIKTTLAALEEYQALDGHPDRPWPLLAAVRFLASPVTERSSRAAVRRSIRWVVDGRTPRKLTQ